MNDELESLIPALAMVAATGSTNGKPRLGLVGAAEAVSIIEAARGVGHSQALTPAFVKLSHALGHPTLVPAVSGETVEAALIRMAAERITELTTARPASAPGIALESGEFIPAENIQHHPV